MSEDDQKVMRVTALAVALIMAFFSCLWWAGMILKG